MIFGKNKRLGIKTNIWLYEALVLSTLRYGAETRTMRVVNMKRRLHTTNGNVGKWESHGEIKSEMSRTRTERMEVILRKIRLQWLGHVHRMNDRRTPCWALTWLPKDGRRGPGRPRKSWSDTVIEDLQNIEMTWTDSGETADDRALWKSCIANVFPKHVEGLR